MHTDSLPAPIVSADLDLRHMPSMLLDVARLRDSTLAVGDPAAAFYAVLLWCASWHQLPASSLPDDDRVLARICGLPVDRWREFRPESLHGFIKCSDGRLYHPVVAEKAIEAHEASWKRKRAGATGANARWEKHRQQAAVVRSHATVDAKAMRSHSDRNAACYAIDAKGREGNQRTTDEVRILTDSQYGISGGRTQPLVIEKIATSSLRAANSLDPIKARNGSVSVLVPETVDALNGGESHGGSTPDIETLQ
jgi:uncharacterized protein YdaU (DUF1376 family)